MKAIIVPIDLSIGNLMTIKEWIDHVKTGNFIDYDGFGLYADPIKGIMCNDMDNPVKPSHVEKNLIDKKWTHIIWYNR